MQKRGHLDSPQVDVLAERGEEDGWSFICGNDWLSMLGRPGDHSQQAVVRICWEEHVNETS